MNENRSRHTSIYFNPASFLAALVLAGVAWWWYGEHQEGKAREARALAEAKEKERRQAEAYRRQRAAEEEARKAEAEAKRQADLEKTRIAADLRRAELAAAAERDKLSAEERRRREEREAAERKEREALELEQKLAEEKRLAEAERQRAINEAANRAETVDAAQTEYRKVFHALETLKAQKATDESKLAAAQKRVAAAQVTMERHRVEHERWKAGEGASRAQGGVVVIQDNTQQVTASAKKYLAAQDEHNKMTLAINEYQQAIGKADMAIRQMENTKSALALKIEQFGGQVPTSAAAPTTQPVLAGEMKPVTWIIKKDGTKIAAKTYAQMGDQHIYKTWDGKSGKVPDAEVESTEKGTVEIQ